MKKARMNISHSRFILFKLKIFGEIVTTKFFCHSNFFTNSIFKRPRIYSKRPIKGNVEKQIKMERYF